MLGIQTRAFEKPAEKAKEGICAVIYGKNGSYIVEVYRMNGKVARSTEDIKPYETHRFSGECASRKGGRFIEDLCGDSPVFIGEESEISGDGFSAICVKKILDKYADLSN